MLFQASFFLKANEVWHFFVTQTGNILVHTFSIIFLHTTVILFRFISELSSHGGTYRPLHATGVRLLATEEKHQRLRQSGIHQPGQTQQSLLT